MPDSDSKVFTGAGADWHNRALLGYAHIVPWSAYVIGYKEAADRLVRGIDEGQHGQDMLVFPILFLYRQYLELSIKWQIRDCQMLLAIERPKKPKGRQQRIVAAQGHDLTELWSYLQQLLKRVYPGLAGSVISEIDRIICAFAELDPIGDEARYPLNMAEKKSLRSLEEINLRQLAEDMMRAESSLTQIEGGIDWEFDQRKLDSECNNFSP